MINIFDLVKDETYTVTQDFIDYGKQSILKGTRLSYVTKSFDGASGSYLLVFKECKLHLQEEANRDLIDNLQNYLALDPALSPLCQTTCRVLF